MARWPFQGGEASARPWGGAIRVALLSRRRLGACLRRSEGGAHSAGSGKGGGGGGRGRAVERAPRAAWPPVSTAARVSGGPARGVNASDRRGVGGRPGCGGRLVPSCLGNHAQRARRVAVGRRADPLRRRKKKDNKTANKKGTETRRLQARKRQNPRPPTLACRASPSLTGKYKGGGGNRVS